MPQTIDFTKVKGLEPIPADWYPVSVVAAEEGTSQKGNALFNIRYKVEGGPFDGRQIFDSWTFTEASLWRVKVALEALGYKMSTKGNTTIVPEDLIGLSCLAHVKIEIGNGTDPKTGEPYPDRNRVDKYKSLSGSAKGAKDLI